MDKIKISRVSDRVFQLKGFSGGPFSECLSCPCGEDEKGDACCHLGVYVDKESYDLIIKNRELIEKSIKIPLKDCFEREWSPDNEFLGGKSIGGIIRQEDSFCVFHSLNGRGCELIKLVIENKLPQRTIPSACRIYPVTWDNGELYVANPLQKSCYCSGKKNNKQKSIFETQKKEIEDIFEINA